MKNQIAIPDEIISNRIYLIRDQKVMIDKYLAELYQVQTSHLNRAVLRNSKRFPEDFMFQLTENEFKILIYQNGISSWGGTRKLPYVFTEQVLAMLSGVLNSDRAIEVNIQIMRIFIKVRQTLNDNTELKLEIEKIKNKLNNTDKNTELLFRYLDELSERIPIVPEESARKRIGYKPDDD